MAKIHLRDASPEDVPTILALIKELAMFEREPDAVVATEDDLLRDGFGPEKRFGCRVVELDGRVVGFALWFFSYSTWLGRAGIYLEDLYVAEAARGHGLGRRLIIDMAQVAVRHEAPRLDLSVLDWNPARGFYERLGIQHRADWAPYRIDGEALRRLAADGS
ncbi:MAG TPA: GNAT family N-acetyltransferase [Aliidongia sp.]|uniref:GNAT family N-acetyltransferase n=1 Tax=Aliidongia sp. TaxID=1914230 RepID=UPI002DDCDCCE|nr:GNAT family N-acetyltransferase [Aliidongia sp.]HEV2676672.1 GNAT family N-acetyltransferase [Aliidongia sp.]